MNITVTTDTRFNCGFNMIKQLTINSNCLGVFDHFVGLSLKGYTIVAKLVLKTEYTHKTQSNKHILESLTLGCLCSALDQMHWFDEKLNMN